MFDLWKNQVNPIRTGDGGGWDIFLIFCFNFQKYSGFDIFEEGQIFRPSTLKTENVVKKNLMVAYVHIEYSTYQFSEESKGVGILHPPP